MDREFKPPVDEVEFAKRADEMTLVGAKTLRTAVERRRAAALKPYDAEIEFLDKVIDRKEKEVSA